MRPARIPTTSHLVPAPIPGEGGPPGTYDETDAYDTVGNFAAKAGVAYAGYGAGAGKSGHAHAPATVGGQAYAYDANGNVTSGGSRTYVWDADNRPTSITGPDGVTESYGYDADGARVSRARAGVTTTYLAGAWEQDVQGGASATTRAFVTLQGRMIAQRERVVSPASDTTIYLHGDHLGSVSAATSGTGAILSRQAFTPWGELRAGGGDVTQTTRDFTGQTKDATGLLFYNARYYDPMLGRFLSADSVAPARGMPQTRNRYSYVLNNPLKYTDPTGHCTDTPQTEEDYQENDRCTTLMTQLYETYGIDTMLHFGSWLSTELATVRQAVLDWMAAAGWDAATFKAQLGGLTLMRHNWQGRAHEGWGVINLYDNDFDFAGGVANIKRTLVHEMAHWWEEKQGLLGEFLRTTGGEQGPFCFPFNNCNPSDRDDCRFWNCYYAGEPDRSPSRYALDNAWEDFAESVTATVYGVIFERGRSNARFYGSTRECYIYQQFARANGYASTC